jgi:hypothetical protein
MPSGRSGAVLSGLAKFERDLIRTRTGEGRARSVTRGVKMGRESKAHATPAARGDQRGLSRKVDKDMGQDEIERTLAERLAKQRGYADFFDWPDKAVKEWGIANSFLEEFKRDDGLKIVSGKQHPGGQNHAPDCQVTTDTGEIWGVEITELVSQKAIESTKRGKSFLAAWPDDDLIATFEALIAGKDCPEKVRGGPYDRYILLVHVDEDMLPGKRLKAVLGSRDFQTRLIDDIYVLVSYDPGEGRMPLLRFDTTRM